MNAKNRNRQTFGPAHILVLRLLCAIFVAGVSLSMVTPAPAEAATCDPYAAACEVGWEISTASPGDDMASYIYTLPFTFTYYGTPYTQFYISSNGFISFDTGNRTTKYTNENLPNGASTPNAYIAPFWDDLVVYNYGSSGGYGKVYYQYQGTSPNRKVVVQWTNAGFYNSTVPLGTIQVILYENNNSIQFQYPQLIGVDPRTLGAEATIGVENANGSSGTLISFDAGTNVVLDNQSMRLTPSGTTMTVQNPSTYEPVTLYGAGNPPPGEPVLISPADVGEVYYSKPSFYWNASDNTTKYHLFVSTVPSLNNPVVDVDITSPTTMYKTTKTLSSGTTYYWAVRAYNANDGGLVTWSSTWSFKAVATLTGKSFLTPAAVDENLNSGTLVGNLTSTVPGGATVTGYALVDATGCPGTDNASFAISGTSLNTAVKFDYETKSSYTICVRTSGTGFSTFDTPFTVTVNNQNDPPLGVTDSYSLANRGGTISKTAVDGLLKNDTDQDAGDILTAEKYSDPAHGTVTINADGSFSYTNNSDMVATDSFTYIAKDASASSAPVTVNISITELNRAPTASNDSYSVNEGAVLNVAAAGVMSNDNDLDGDPMTAIKLTNPAHGTLTLNANGSFTYTHDGSETTSDSFTYKVSDVGSLESGVATVSLTINPVNDAPVAVDDSGYTVAEGGILNGSTVLANDTDPDSGSRTAIKVSDPASGALTLNANGTFTYTHDGGETTSDSFTYKANDGSLDSNEVSVSITVTPVNDAPQALNNSYTVAEGDTFSIAAPGILANDKDLEHDVLTAIRLSDPLHGALTFGTDGSLTYVHDGGETTNDNFTYKANDGALDSNTATVTFTITPVNDAPTNLALSASTVAENAASGTSVGTLSSTDVDSSSFTYTLVSGTGDDDNASFSITGSTLKTAAVFDFEAKSSYSVRVQTDDGSGGTYQKAFTITVTNVNEAPTDISLSASTVAENAASGTTVGTLSSTDVDSAGFTYTLVAGTGATDNASFSITGSTLKTAAVFDYETKNSFSIRVKTDDGSGGTFEKIFTVTATNVNESPTDISLSASTVAENAASGTTVGTLSSTDGDSASFTYTLVAGTGATDNASFSITGSTLKTNAVFDFEAKSSYSVRVQTDDGSGGTYAKAFTISVTNVNESPTDISLSASTVAENAASGTTVGTLSSTDGDSASFTYTLVAGTGSDDNASFSITGSTLKTAAVFDYETKNSFSIRVKTDDGSGGTFEKIFTVTATNVNEAPSDISLSASTVAENAASGTTVGTLSSTDVDSASFTYTLVAGTGSDDNASFSITGSTLKTNAVFNYELKNSYTVRVQTSDGSGGTYQKAFVITVTNVNEAPTAVADSGYTVAEAGVLSGSTVLTNDTDPDGNSLTAVKVSDPAHGTLTLNSNGTFTYTHDGGETTSDSFTYKANDGSLDGNVVSVSITVTPVNDAPTNIALSASTVAENAASGTTVGTLSSTDVDSASFTYTLVAGTGSEDNASFSITGSTLKTAAVFNYESKNTYNIRVQTSDGSGGTYPKAFTVTVTNVNEAPVAVADSGYTVAEGGTLSGSTVLANDTDPESGAMTAVKVTDPAHGTLTLNSDGTFTYTHDGGETTSDSFTYKANDGSLDSNVVAASITVTAANDAPTNIALSASTVAENAASGTTVGTLSSTDVDSAGFTYTLVAGTGATDNASFSITGSTLKTAAVFDYETKNSFSIRVKTDDGSGGTFEKIFTVTATNVNEAPSDISLSASTVAENAASGTTVGTLSSTDVDSASFTYTLVAGTGSTDNASFSITGSTLKTAAVFDFETKTSYSIRVKTDDGTGGTFEKVFTITVTNVNESPSDVALSANTVVENAASGTTVGTLSSTDVDSASFTYTLVAGTGSTDNASFSITGNTLKTAAVFDFETKSSYSVRIQTDDGSGGTYPKVFTITVTGANDAPTNISLSASTVAENSASGTTVGTLSSTDVDSSTFTYTLVAGTGSDDNASFSITGSTLKTAAVFDYEIKNSFSIRVKTDDGSGGTFEKAFTVTATNANEAPLAVADSGYTVAEGGTLSGSTVLVNDTDPELNSLTAVKVTNPAHGTLTLNSNGTFTYTHDGGETTSDSFTYKANDGSLDSNVVAVSITVTAVNDVPTDMALSATSLNEGQAVGTTVGTLSTTDADNASFTYTLVAGSGATDNASFSITGSALKTAAVFDFEAKSSYSIRVQTDDGNGGTLQKAYTITVVNVNETPVAGADTYTVAEGGSLSIGAPGVLSNDSDPDGAALTATNAGTTAHGTLTLNANGSFTYVHDGGESSSDSFTYQASDGVLQSTAATVNITVTPVNDGPTDIALSTNTIAENQPSGTTLGTFSTTDVDSSSFTYTLVGGTGSTNNASFTISGNELKTAAAFNFEAKSSYSIRVQSSDGGATTQKAFTITVTDVNEAPVGTNDTYNVDKTKTLTIDATLGVRVNDNDPDLGATLTVIPVDLPAYASPFTLNADGSFTYTHDGTIPDPDVDSFEDSFTYKVSDGSLESALTTVTITINVTNAAPEAIADSYTVSEGGTLSPAALDGLLKNDTDIDGDSLTALVASNPAHGSVTVNADGSFVYTHDGSQTTSDSFMYKANDGKVDSNPALVSITVTPANDAPQAVDDEYSVQEGGTLNTPAAGVLSNDSDEESSPLSAALVDDVAHGTLTLNADGSFTYTHDGSETTSDSFTYKANDGTVDGNVATVTITIVPLNEAPTAAADMDTYTVAEGATLDVPAPGVLSNDTDPDGDSLSAIMVTGTRNGALTLNADGSFQYVHDGSETTTDNFTYKASDGSLESTAVNVPISITPTNDAPSDFVLDPGIGEEETPVGTSVGSFTTTDVDGGPTYTYTLVAGTGDEDNASFTIEADTLKSAVVFTFALKSEYHVRVRVDDGNGGTLEKEITVTVADPDQSSPTAFKATDASAGLIDLSWVFPFTNTGFYIERSRNGVGNWEQIGTTETNVKEFEDTGLNCGTLYYYRVRAGRPGSLYSLYSEIISAGTTTCNVGPDSPTQLEAVMLSSSQIALNWVDNADDEDLYIVERSVDTTNWTELEQLPKDTVYFEDEGLACGVDYLYRVRALRKSDGAYSWYSHEVQVAPAECTNIPSPENNMLVDTWSPTFMWERMEGYALYNLQVVKLLANNKSQVVARLWVKAEEANCPVNSVVQVCSYRPKQYKVGTTVMATLINGNYSWRVYGATSKTKAMVMAFDWQKFNTPAVPGKIEMTELVSPSVTNPPSDWKPTFSWPKSQGAQKYNLVIARGKTKFLDILLPAGSLKCEDDGMCSYKPSYYTINKKKVSELKGGNYSWMVRSINPSGKSAFSTAVSFDTPSAPSAQATLISPASGALPSTWKPNFVWQAVDRATSYQILMTFTIAKAPTTVRNYPKMIVTAQEAGCVSDSTCEFVPKLPLTVANYTWSVVSINPSGLGPVSATTSFTTPSTLPSNVVILSPNESNPALDWKPTLTWAALDDIKTYRIQLWSGTKRILDVQIAPEKAGCTEGIGSECHYTLTKALSGYQHSWKVAAINPSGMGAWTEVTKFNTPAAPAKATLVAPSAAVPLTTWRPIYQWEKVPNVERYQIQVVNKKTNLALTSSKWLTPTQLDCVDDDTCEYAVTDVMRVGQYKWRIVGWNPSGLGAWSDYAEYSTPTAEKPAVPVAVSPVGTTVENWLPTYRWTGVEGAVSYQVQALNSFHKVVFSSWVLADKAGCATGGECSLTATRLLGKGPYSWKVLAWNPVGSSAFTAEAAFTTPDAPGVVTTTAPTGTVNDSQPALLWNKIDTATHYKVQIINKKLNRVVISGRVSTQQARCLTTNVCVYVPYKSLPNNEYIWKVAAWNPSTLATQADKWSELKTMTINATALPGSAKMLDGATGMTTATPTYTWLKISKATRYLLWVDGPAGNIIQEWYEGPIVCSDATWTCTVTPDVVMPYGDYTWKVITWNSYGNGPWSDVMTFTVPEE